MNKLTVWDYSRVERGWTLVRGEFDYVVRTVWTHKVHRRVGKS